MSDHASEAEDPAAAELPAEPPPADLTPPADPVPLATLPPALLRMRRAPRYRSFGYTGAAIGIIAGVAVALSYSATSDYSTRTIVGYFAAILGLVGAVLGLGLAVLIERRRTDRNAEPTGTPNRPERRRT